jgi:adenylate kinase family enzyme
MIRRIHILGAYGSGTTTLGRALAARLQYLYFDMDDYLRSGVVNMIGSLLGGLFQWKL